ncbi:DUF5985 family protein [Verrucomicrobiota bacterium sgz303538]
MAQIVYILCALTSLMCAVLLGRAYKANRVPLLFWSALCFAGLTLTNILLCVDLVMLGPEISLVGIRAAVALVSVCLLLYGLIFKST